MLKIKDFGFSIKKVLSWKKGWKETTKKFNKQKISMSKGRELRKNPSKQIKWSEEFEGNTEIYEVSFQVLEEGKKGSRF